jgi:hypothetical protein
MNYGQRMLFGTACMVSDTGKVSATGLASVITCCITQPGLRNRLTSTYGNSTLQDSKFACPVTIEWGAGAENETQWNNIAAWVIETFGLPGDRYTTDISTEHMTWFFKSDQDAVFMKLKYGVLAHLYDYR